MQCTFGAFGIIVDKGLCADWTIHDSENDKGQRNLHIHVLLTMCPITENGERMQSLFEQGGKIAPKQWKVEIQSLQAEYDNISKEKSKTATESAYAEVISYNKKILERELQNESRQHSKTKRREEEI